MFCFNHSNNQNVLHPNQAFQCLSHNFTHQILNRILLLIAGTLLASELNLLSRGMSSIYTSALHSHNYHNTGLSSAAEDELQANNVRPNQCPEGPPPQWESQLDVASKAYLAPIVMSGKLISISEDYGGRIGATFQVKKLIKNQSSLSHNLVIASHVTLYFVRNKLLRSEPPFCAIYMNDNLVKLRPQEKYIIFASEPFSLFSNSVHNLNSIAINVNSNHQLLRPNANSANSPNSPTSALSHTVINLSTFASPEVQNKRSSRLVRKVLCSRCAKTPIVRGFNGDLRVATKGNLRLRCKVSGNPLPWVEWFRNGKRLRNRGRVTIKTRRRTSRLEIRRVSPLTDSGYYECRAMNVVAKEPSIARQRVIITQSNRKSHSSSPSTTTTRGPLWPQVRPCPIPSFCLNGGTCTLYEAVGEYVCQCADGYMGQRCESKDIYLKLTVTFDRIHYN